LGKLDFKELLFVSEDQQNIFYFTNDDFRMNLIDVYDDFPLPNYQTFDKQAQ